MCEATYVKCDQATITTRNTKNIYAFVARNSIISSDTYINFVKELQFPVKLVFAMAINKAQGQSLNVASVNFEMSCLLHGQM